MNYFADFKFFQDVFQVPKDVGEKHLKLATPTQLRVLLYVLSHLNIDPAENDISAFLGLPESEVLDALKFWESTGILVSKTGPTAEPQEEKPKKKIVRKAAIKPTKEEIVQRGLESEQLRMLLHEAEEKFSRPLQFGEISTLVWLFDNQGMDTSLILMVIEYAKQENKCNIGFIERTAIEWLNNDITDILSAENYLRMQNEKKTAWKIVEASFGIESRLPSKKELDYSKLWVVDFGFGRQILSAAYERCVDAKSKFDMRYTAKILENWHSKGYSTLDEILAGEEKQKAEKSGGMATYNLSDLEKLINK